MQTTYKQLARSQGALQALGEMTQGIPADERLKIARLVREVDALAEDYIRVRGELVELHTKRDDDGEPVPFVVKVRLASGEVEERVDPNRFYPKDPEAWEADARSLDDATVTLSASVEYGTIKNADDLSANHLRHLGDLFGWSGFRDDPEVSPAERILMDARTRMEEAERDGENHDGTDVPRVRGEEAVDETPSAHVPAGVE